MTEWHVRRSDPERWTAERRRGKVVVWGGEFDDSFNINIKGGAHVAVEVDAPLIGVPKISCTLGGFPPFLGVVIDQISTGYSDFGWHSCSGKTHR